MQSLKLHFFSFLCNLNRETEGETSSEYNGTSEKDVETSKEDPAENMVIQGENEDSESGVIQQDKSDSLQTCSHESTDGALNDKSFENAGMLAVIKGCDYKNNFPRLMRDSRAYYEISQQL